METVLKQDNLGISEKTINAFYQQWELFPEFVALVKRDHRVIALNKAAREIGFPQGIKCYDLVDKEIYNTYLADNALSEEKAKVKVITGDPRESNLTVLSYWVPLHEEKDLCVYFNIDISQYADPKKVKKTDDVTSITSLKIVKYSANIFFKLFTKWRNRKQRD